jgi:hypothetical protein
MNKLKSKFLIEKGILLKQGYMIVGESPVNNDQLTVEVKKMHEERTVSDLCGQYQYDLAMRLGSFAGNYINRKRQKRPFDLEKDELEQLKQIYDLENVDEENIEKLCWQIVKAQVASSGDITYLGRTHNKLFVRHNNILIDQGIIDQDDVISKQKHKTVKQYLQSQQNIEQLVQSLQIHKNQEMYQKGDFSQIQKIYITLSHLQ